MTPSGPGRDTDGAQTAVDGSGSAARQSVGGRAAAAVAGLLCASVGATVIFKPFASLALLVVVVVAGLLVAAVAEVVEGRRSRSESIDRVHDGFTASRLHLVSAVVLVVAALVLVIWPGPSLRVVAVAVGFALVSTGLLEGAGARTLAGAARAAAYVGAVASVVFGLLALAWPDLTTLVVAAVFGAKLVVAGVRLVVGALRGLRPPAVAGRSTVGEPPDQTDGARPGRRTRAWWALARNTVGVLVALVLVAVSVSIRASQPHPDGFYDPPSGALSSKARPGTLLRSERFTSSEVPRNAVAWRILYTTTVPDGRRTRVVAASGLVLAPKGATTDGAPPAKVIAWAHGTTGAARDCAPSVLEGGLSKGAMFVPDDVIDAGWALVATDYVGLGTHGPHAYLVGQPEGWAVLDSVRAAKQLPGVSLADDTVVWGHSQGGQAALWAGVLAASYTPDVKVDGVAAMAPASNPPALLDNLTNVTGGELFASYVIKGYADTYDDVGYGRYVRGSAETIVRELGDRCLSGKGVLVSVLTALLLDKPIWRGNPNRGALHTRLEQNIPAGPIAAPVLIGQGTKDSIVAPAAQDAYVDQRCAAGYAVDYRRYDGLDHVPLVEPDSPAVADWVSWTTDRFAGEPAADTCTTR